MSALSCTGAVLIGGKSSRMGGASRKHELVLPDGRTMLQHVMEALAAMCTNVVLIDSKGQGDAPGHLTIPDVRPDAGPLGGMEALLASGLDLQYLICPCDVPLITPDVLRLLLQAPESLATVFQIEGHKEIDPLPARIRAEVLPVVRRLLNSQERSVWNLMQEIHPHVVAITGSQAVQLHNVNTMKDYERLASIHPIAR